MVRQNLEDNIELQARYKVLKFFVLKTWQESCYCLRICFINISVKQILLSFVDNISYKHIEPVYLVFH